MKTWAQGPPFYILRTPPKSKINYINSWLHPHCQVVPDRIFAEREQKYCQDAPEMLFLNGELRDTFDPGHHIFKKTH